MKNKVKIWEPGSIAFQRFQFPGSAQDTRMGGVSGDGEELTQEEGLPPQEVSSFSPVSQELDGISDESEEQDNSGVAFSVEQHLGNITRESYERGYEEGRRLGFEEAIQQALKQTHQLADDQQQLASSLSEQIQGITEQTANNKEKMGVWLGQLVEEVCRQVIRREIQTNPEHIVRVIRETLALIPDESEYVIHVSDQDAELLSRIVPDLGVQWHMMTSNDIAQGDCLIVARESEAEAKMDTRLDECLNIIKESLPAMVASES